MKLIIALSFLFTLIGFVISCRSVDPIQTKEVELIFIKSGSRTRYEKGSWITEGEFFYKSKDNLMYSFSHYKGKAFLYDERK